MNPPRKVARGAAIGGLAVALTLATATAASAHVTTDASSTAAGSYTIVTVSVPHGCDGAATTSIAVALPESIVSVTPTALAGWRVEKVMEALAEPVVDAHGNRITQRVDRVVYTADTPLPAEVRAAFELSLQLPADAAGTTLYFPTVQTCERGEMAWIQTPAAGEDGHDLAAPAPAVAVTAATDHLDDVAHADAAASAASGGQPADATGLWLGAAGLVAGLAGLAAGGIALARSRPRA